MFDLWGPHLKGIMILWVHSPLTGQQLHNEVTTSPKSCLKLSFLHGEVANSTFPCLKALASACKLLTPRISKSRPFLGWGRQLGGAQAYGSHFPAHDIFFHWLKQQLLFGGPCLLTTVFEHWSGHFQIGQCEITSLESDFCCPDCPCYCKLGPGVKEQVTNI